MGLDLGKNSFIL